MTHATNKDRCPQCARLGKDTRGDNYVTYSDGHSYCYGCGHYNNSLSNRLSNTKEQPTLNKEPIHLPRDICIDYPQKVIDWIGSYELTIEDLHNHNFLWSEYFQRLIYPVWQGEDVIFWTGRYFGQDAKQAKWINRGSPKDIVHCINKNANGIIVIVEDCISGIKILKAGLGLGVLVLFNSHNPVSKLLKIGKDKQYILWLDNDKFKESILFAREAVGHGFHVKVVVSTCDPKDEDIVSIKRTLT